MRKGKRVDVFNSIQLLTLGELIERLYHCLRITTAGTDQWLMWEAMLNLAKLQRGDDHFDPDAPLKPCPFCGGRAEIVNVPGDRDGPESAMSHCMNCGANGPSVDPFNYLEPNGGVPNDFQEQIGRAAAIAWQGREDNVG